MYIPAPGREKAPERSDSIVLVYTGCKENHFYSLPFGQAEASIY